MHGIDNAQCTLVLLAAAAAAFAVGPEDLPFRNRFREVRNVQIVYVIFVFVSFCCVQNSLLFNQNSGNTIFLS